MNIVERVARTLDPELWEIVDAFAWRKRNLRGFFIALRKNRSLRSARRVIMAIREPTNAMLKCGADELLAMENMDVEQRVLIVLKVWQRMIDVGTNEET